MAIHDRIAKPFTGAFDGFFDKPIWRSRMFWGVTGLCAIAIVYVFLLLFARWTATSGDFRFVLVALLIMAPIPWAMTLVQHRRSRRLLQGRKPAPLFGLSFNGESARATLMISTVSYLSLIITLSLLLRLPK
jgi:hypothetical protein